MEFKQYFENSLKLYFNFKDSLKHVKKLAGWKIGFITLIFLQFISLSISNLIIGTELLLFVGTLLFGLIGFVAFSLLGYGLLHLILKLFKAKGVYHDTLRLGLAVAVFPSVVSIFTVLLSYFDGFIEFVVAIIGFAVAIWSIITLVRVYSDFHKVSQLKVFLSIVIYFVILSIPIILAIVALSMMGVPAELSNL